MHCPANKLVSLKKKTPRLIEGTVGNLTEKEKKVICENIMAGWVCGHNLIDEPYTISWNLISTRISLK